MEDGLVEAALVSLAAFSPSLQEYIMNEPASKARATKILRE